jgi:predicted metal-dependent hydrolase
MVGRGSYRYMLYLRNETFSPKDADLLVSKARSLLRGQDVIIRDTRVSSQHVEYDVSIVATEDLKIIEFKLSVIGKLIDVYPVIEREYGKKQAILMAINYFNEEKYWITHELLEGVWKKSNGDEKKVLNGLILIAAAFVHYQKGESKVALGIMSRALEKLKLANGEYYQINIDSLKLNINNMLRSNSLFMIRL